MQIRTVQVLHLSDLATEREIHEFFSFSGDIESVEIIRDFGQLKMAYVTFKDPKALEIALLLSGATIVDQLVSITPVENYVPKAHIQGISTSNDMISVAADENALSTTEDRASSPGNRRVYANKAHGVVTNMFAKGSAIGQDAMNKAKAFDEKHQIMASASAKVISLDQKVGLTEKLTVGVSAVNEKIKSVDERLHVSDKTMAAIFAAERKLNDTRSAVKTSRFVSLGTTWLNKVSRAGQVAGSKTREKFHLAVSNLTAKDPIAV